jgi:hypothetical protein
MDHASQIQPLAFIFSQLRSRIGMLKNSLNQLLRYWQVNEKYPLHLIPCYQNILVDSLLGSVLDLQQSFSLLYK